MDLRFECLRRKPVSYLCTELEYTDVNALNLAVSFAGNYGFAASSSLESWMLKRSDLHK